MTCDWEKWEIKCSRAERAHTISAKVEKWICSYVNWTEFRCAVQRIIDDCQQVKVCLTFSIIWTPTNLVFLCGFGVFFFLFTKYNRWFVCARNFRIKLYAVFDMITSCLVLSSYSNMENVFHFIFLAKHVFLHFNE